MKGEEQLSEEEMKDFEKLDKVGVTMEMTANHAAVLLCKYSVYCKCTEVKIDDRAMLCYVNSSSPYECNRVCDLPLHKKTAPHVERVL